MISRLTCIERVNIKILSYENSSNSLIRCIPSTCAYRRYIYIYIYIHICNIGEQAQTYIVDIIQLCMDIYSTSHTFILKIRKHSICFVLLLYVLQAKELHEHTRRNSGKTRIIRRGIIGWLLFKTAFSAGSTQYTLTKNKEVRNKKKMTQ